MWVIFLILGIAVLLAFILIIIYIQYTRDYWRFLEIPHETPKNLAELFKTVIGRGTVAYENAYEHHMVLYKRFKGTGPFCGFYQLMQPRMLVLDRELIKQILTNDFSNFNDRGRYYNTKHDPLSGDLYSLCGNEWMEMRMKLEPTFRKSQMSVLFPSIYDDSEKLCDIIELALKQQEEQGFVEIKSRLRRYVLTSIATSVFGLNDRLQQKYNLDEFDINTQLAVTTQHHGKCLSKTLSHYPKTGRRLRFKSTPKKVSEYFLALIADVVSQRELYKVEDSPDYLQLLINIMKRELSTHETKIDSDAKGLKEHLLHELSAHAILFLKSGLETTTNALCYVLYELAIHEDIQTQLREEIKDALKSHGNELNYECLKDLKFMGQVISETLRIHPVKAYLTRRTLNDYRVPNHPKYLISKDIYVIIPTHAIHNDPEYFSEPQLFKPERFSATENKSREICTWLGFGAGPRSCIGIHFAQMQIRVALAQLLIRYRFILDRRRITIKCQDGVALCVERIGKQQKWRESAIEI